MNEIFINCTCYSYSVTGLMHTPVSHKECLIQKLNN